MFVKRQCVEQHAAQFFQRTVGQVIDVEFAQVFKLAQAIGGDPCGDSRLWCESCDGGDGVRRRIVVTKSGSGNVERSSGCVLREYVYGRVAALLRFVGATCNLLNNMQ